MTLTPEQKLEVMSLSADSWSERIVGAIREWLEYDRVNSGLFECDRGGDVAVILAKFWRSLDESADLKPSQDLFCEGLSQAIESCRVEWPGYDAVQTLLGIVDELKTDSLNQTLLSVVQYDGFQSMSVKEQRNIQALILGIIRRQAPMAPVAEVSGPKPPHFS